MTKRVKRSRRATKRIKRSRKSHGKKRQRKYTMKGGNKPLFYKMKKSEKRYLEKTKKLAEVRDAAYYKNKKKLWFYVLLLLFNGSFSRNIITNIKFAYRK